MNDHKVETQTGVATGPLRWAAPSLMCLDYLEVRSQLEIISKRAAWGHIDVMDGHFAPNLAISPDMVRAFRRVTDMPLDVHLMTCDPSRWIDVFAKAGASAITLHRETIDANAFRLFDLIESLGCVQGLALCPPTTIESAKYLLPRVKILTIMTVDIGYAGSPFIARMLEKIEQARAFRDKEGLDLVIQADGACNRSTFKSLRDAGVDRFVLGSALFNRDEAKHGLDFAFDAVSEEFDESRA